MKPRPAQRDYCPAPASVETIVRERWERLHGRTMRWDQREALAAELAMYARLEARKGAVIDLTLEQWCIELGLPVDGLSYEQISARYGTRRINHDRELLALGFLEQRECIIRPGTREPSHILVRIPGPVAQLVRAPGS